MKVIIIEDERAAVRNLISLLNEIRPEAEIVTVIDSVAGTLEWFAEHPLPDLLFMDIHLADGSAFEIFEHIPLSCPIIFTTAYDEYALRAFKVNSIDYLLKPIGQADIEHALQKLERLIASPPSGTQHEQELLQLMRLLNKKESFKSHFLIPVKGDKLLPVPVEMIRLFYIRGCQVKAVLNDRSEYAFTQTLDELTDCLDPAHFFRVNRQYLISREAIKDIDLWFNGRLSVNLHHFTPPEKILVSKARVGEFKEWFSSSVR